MAVTNTTAETRIILEEEIDDSMNENGNFNMLDMTPVITEISLDEEMAILQTDESVLNTLTTRNAENNADTFIVDSVYNNNNNKVILQVKDQVGKSWNDGNVTVDRMQTDFEDFKRFVTVEIAQLKEVFSRINIGETDVERKYLEIENENLRSEVNELRKMVKDLVDNMCKSNIEYSDIVKIDKVSRQNHSSGKIQMSEKSRNETPIYVNDDIGNVVDNGMSSKWLLPKKT